MVKKNFFFANVTNYLHAEIGSLHIVKSCVTIYDGKCLALFSLHGLPPSQV